MRRTLRLFSRSPGFAAVVILTVAAAVGATASVFTVVRALLLRPLPYADSGNLVRLYDSWRQFERGTPSLAEYRQDFEPLHTASVAAWGYGSGNFAGSGAPEHVLIGRATVSLLPLLGVRPRLGRWFTPDEEEPGRGRVLVIGPALWHRRFGGDPAVVGRTVQVSGVPMTIVGVLGDDLELPESFEAWTPLAFPPDRLTTESRSSHFLRVIGRIRPGRTLADLRSELAVVSARLRSGLPQIYPPDSGFRYGAVPLLDQMVGGVRRAIWMLFVAVLLVLLMACANVGNLMLARSAARQREIAIRAALGAGRSRLVRQMLVESVILASIGGALGVLLAVWSIDLLPETIRATLPRGQGLRLDLAVVAFASFTSVASGILFGLAPALAATDLNLEEALRSGGTSAAPGAGKLRRTLVAADVTLAVVLVCGAALMLRSFGRLLAVDPGFQPRGSVALELSVPGDRDRQHRVFHAVLQRLRELPGAVAAGAIDYAPLSGVASDRAFELEGHPVPPGIFPPDEEMRVVTPGWLEAMGVRLLGGRTLVDDDPARSIVVNDAFARRYFPGADAVGRRLRFEGESPWTIVGVVGDVRDFGLDEDARPTFYVPYDRFSQGGTMTIALRSSAPARETLQQAVHEVAAVDATLPAYRTRTIAAALEASLAQREFTLQLLHGFAVLALLLAGLGLYGVLAYSVSQRTREVGVRMALGASPKQAILLVARESAAMVGTGLALGCAGALASARLLTGLLFGIGPGDPLSLAAAIVVLAAVAAAATLVPARRAARIDPAVALRAE